MKATTWLTNQSISLEGKNEKDAKIRYRDIYSMPQVSFNFITETKEFLTQIVASSLTLTFYYSFVF